VDEAIAVLEPSGALGRCAATGARCSEAIAALEGRHRALTTLRDDLAADLFSIVPPASGLQDPMVTAGLARFDEFLSELGRFLTAAPRQRPSSAQLAALEGAARRTIHSAPATPRPPGPPEFRSLPFQSAPRLTRERADAASPRAQAQAATPAFIPPEYLQETLEVRFSPDLDVLIDRLKQDPLLVFGFVRDEVRYQPYYGSMKDSQHVLDTLGGNDFDQASLLIALYRRMGIPSRYVRGNVELPIDRARRWLGVTDSQTAGDILATAGVPATLIVNGSGTIISVRFEHVWVEAYVAFADYRGIPNHAGGAAWVPLAPALEDLEANGGPDLGSQSGLDADAFLHTFIAGPTPRSPAEQYILDLQDFAETNYPGQNFYDVLWATDTIPDELALAPASLPATTLSVIETTAAIPAAKRHRVRFQAGGLDHTGNLVELVGRRVTLAYEPATQADRDTIAAYGDIYDTPPWLINVRPELRIGGALAASGVPIGFGRQDNFTLTFSVGAGPPAGAPVGNVITAAGRYAVGIAAQDISSLVVRDRTAAFDAGIAAIGQPGFDTDATLGEALFMHAMAYWQELDQMERLLARSMQVIPLRDVSEAIVGTATVVFYSGPNPVDVDAGGIYIDVDRSIVSPFSIDGDPSPRRDFTILAGATGSALEHVVFQEIWGNESISTIAILQRANASGIPVYDIDQTNRASLVPLLTHPSSVIAAVNADLDAGRRVTIPRDPITVNLWSGTGWIGMDMATGAAGYLISGGLSGVLAGGSFTQFQQYVEDLVRTGQITRAEADSLIQQARERIHVPVGDRVTSQWGWRTDPITGRRTFHEGVDFGSANGTDVMSGAPGRVARSYTSTTFGETVIINHGTDANGNTIYSLYAHNQTRLVNAGDAVTAGQQIADSDNTGRSTGPHVHYEVIVIPPGGPNPNQSQFFDRQYTVNPTDHMWPALTPPP